MQLSGVPALGGRKAQLEELWRDSCQATITPSLPSHPLHLCSACSVRTGGLGGGERQTRLGPRGHSWLSLLPITKLPRLTSSSQDDGPGASQPHLLGGLGEVRACSLPPGRQSPVAVGVEGSRRKRRAGSQGPAVPPAAICCCLGSEPHFPTRFSPLRCCP